MTVSYDESWGIEILTDDVAEIDEAATTSDGVEIGVGSSLTEQVAQDVIGIEVHEGIPGDKGEVGPSGDSYFTINEDGAIEFRRIRTFDSVQYYLTLLSGTSPAGWTDITALASGTGGTVSGDVLGVIGDFFYVGNSEPFDSILIDIGTARSTGGVFSYEYSTDGDTWTPLDVVDGTNALSVDGIISFDPPADWAQATVNGVPDLYWFRLGVVSGTFSVEPTVYSVAPLTSWPLFSIFGNGGDTTPTFLFDSHGALAIGYPDPATYKLRVQGNAYFSSSIISGSSVSGSTFAAGQSSTDFDVPVGVSMTGSSLATAVAPRHNSLSARWQGSAWDGIASRIQAMEAYLLPDAEDFHTAGRLAFKNVTVDGVADPSELMNLSTNGRLNILGRIESNFDLFDAVFSYVGTTWTDITGLVSSVGTFTGDVLNVVGDYVYVGKATPFDSAYFRFQTIMSAGTTRRWEYMGPAGVWTTLPITVDGTANWSKNGTVEFTPPANWTPGTVNSVENLYWIRVGTVSGAFSVEPTLRLVLPTSEMSDANVVANGEFSGVAPWTTTGDWSYTTNDFTYTYSSGQGTIRQAAADFDVPAKPNTWYRMRYIIGVTGPANTVAWVGEEFADGKAYFSPSTTEVDLYFRTNANPGDFVLYTTATTSGLRLDFLSVMEVVGGDLLTTGTIRAKRDIEVRDPSQGVVLRSPDNSRWRITVDDAGALTTAKI